MMQLFCSNEDMSSPGALNDCFMADGSSDASPPYRSRCNTWPKLVRGLDSESNVSSAATDDSSWGGGSLLPLVSEEADEPSDHFGGTTSCSTPPNSSEVPQQQFSPHQSNNASAAAANSTRRNPWGNCSYADLITQAIQSSADQRLTVSQIYEWLVKNISFFADKGDSNSSAGWKNSIRHNLSLHPKFVRVQNEGTGKSSWWIINPDVKPGVKPSRRRAMSMETSSARQRKNNIGAARSKRRNVSGDHHFHHLHHSNAPSQLERTLSSGSLPPYDYLEHSEPFRPRASSSASSCGQPGSPRHTTSSSDFLNAKVPIVNPSWTGGNSSLSPTLFSVVEKLNLQDSGMEENSVQSPAGDNLDNITLNDLNLDYETTKLLDSFLSPRKSEIAPTTQQKIKILEQRDSTSRGSSMSTSGPSSPPGMSAYSCSFVPQPKIEEDDLTSSYFGPSDGGGMESSTQHFTPQEEQQQLYTPPLYPEHFKPFDESFFGRHEGSSSSYLPSLNYFNNPGSQEHHHHIHHSSVNDNTSNTNSKKAQLTLNSY